MTTTDLSRKQLTTILSALDDAPRNPANKGEALRAIGRSAQRFGLTTEDVLAAAPGLLDERMSPAEFRVELQDLAGTEPQEDAPFVEVTGAPQAQEPAPADHQEAAASESAPEATQAPMDGQPEVAQPIPAPARDEGPSVPEPEAADTGSPAPRTPRAGTKQAKMIELLERPEGATVEQIAEATGWQKHTIRGAISGALKKKLGLTIEAIRIREVGPNQTGAKGSATVYRIPGSPPATD